MVSSRNPLVTLQNPTVKRAAQTIRRAFAERKALVIIGNCCVDYQGRANSKLASGERIVIFKEDGSALVHRPTGYEPVNWQPPGCLFSVREANEALHIRASRRKPLESVKISFDRIYQVCVLRLVDRGEFSLYASEEDMQRAILLKPSLLEPGFKPITYEKKVEPGFVDVYGTDRDGKFVVVEIKRKTAGREAVLQLAKYVNSIRKMVNREVRGVLVAPSTAKDVQRLLVTLGLDFKALDPKKCASLLKTRETRRLVEYFEDPEE